MAEQLFALGMTLSNPSREALATRHQELMRLWRSSQSVLQQLELQADEARAKIADLDREIKAIAADLGSAPVYGECKHTGDRILIYGNDA